METFIKPKKLIRKFITNKLKEGEWEEITDQTELNALYAIKISEELAEIQESKHNDIMEFVDLIQVAFSFARQNGFSQTELSLALIEKSAEKGTFGRLALNNLNPENPSNKLYFPPIQAEAISLEEAKNTIAEKNGYSDDVDKNGITVRSAWEKLRTATGFPDEDIEQDFDEASELYLSQNTAALRGELEKYKVDKETLSIAVKTAQDRANENANKAHNLEQQVKTLAEALKNIDDPISYLRKKAEQEGAQMNGVAALALSQNAEFLKGIAKEALSTLNN